MTYLAAGSKSSRELRVKGPRLAWAKGNRAMRGLAVASRAARGSTRRQEVGRIRGETGFRVYRVYGVYWVYRVYRVYRVWRVYRVYRV